MYLIDHNRHHDDDHRVAAGRGHQDPETHHDDDVYFRTEYNDSHISANDDDCVDYASVSGDDAPLDDENSSA